jgi:hypothetical protein
LESEHPRLKSLGLFSYFCKLLNNDHFLLLLFT